MAGSNAMMAYLSAVEKHTLLPLRPPTPPETPPWRRQGYRALPL
jgi:hypothetical protein